VPPSGFERALIGVVDEVPPALGVLWRLGSAALVLWVVALGVTAVVRRRGEVLVDVIASAVLAVLAGAVSVRAVDGDWPSFSEMATGGSVGAVPLVGLVVGAAVSFAASPHLSLPFRRLGRWVVWIAAGATVMSGSTTPTGALMSLLVATAAAAAVHLALGSSVGRPTLADVADALEQVDLHIDALAVSSRRSTGVVTVDGLDESGRPVLVKVHGRDARDTQVLSRAWRRLWYRGAGPVALSRLQQVEHEGFVTLLAAARGVPAPEVLVAGRTETNDALVVLRSIGTPLVGADTPDDRAIAKVWRCVARLHATGMAHGELSPDSFGLVDGSIVLSDLATVTIAASEDQRRADRAQVLVSTAVLVGIERATVIAAEELGEEGVREMLPYLQLPALGRPLRRELKAAPFDVDALRSAMAAVADVEVPDIAELRRVSPQTLVAVGLFALVAFALVASLGNVDVAELADELRGASITWVVIGLVVAQLPFLSQAVATRGACPRPLAFGPVAMLQCSIAFLALAVPSTAGRLALDIRFFQRQGVPAATALSISAIDGFSGFLVQIALLVMTLVFGLGQVDLSFDMPSVGSSGNLFVLLAVLAGVLVVLVVLAAALPKIRNRILERVRPLLGEVLDTLRSLRSLSKVLQIFGGNLANQLLYALALGACLAAFGGSLNLATLVVVYVGAALFGGLMPVPGGIGVMEAALMAGLTAAGIDATIASATALLFRLVTFYLPPLWGWLALRWLQRHSYL
ncbi:MAG: lysylphosphatidylglycerol synthase domain-containing protein, partial [Microthrixaceae bacterium]